MEVITVYKSSSTGAFGIRKIQIFLDCELPMEGMSATFTLLGVRRKFTSEDVANNNLVIEYTKSETDGFPLGKTFASLSLFDPQGREMRITNRIPVMVKASDETQYELKTETVEV